MWFAVGLKGDILPPGMSSVSVLLLTVGYRVRTGELKREEEDERKCGSSGKQGIVKMRRIIGRAEGKYRKYIEKETKGLRSCKAK